MAKPFLSVVIPAYNEEKRLGSALQEIHRFLAGFKKTHEIIVVDDGSQDQTYALAVGLKIPHCRVLRCPINQGKGAAVQRGVAQACGEMVLFTDADLSTPIRETEHLIRALEQGADVAIASRGLPESRVARHQPFYRETMGKFFNWLVRLLVLPGVFDTQCGFKLFKRRIAREIFRRLTIMRFGFDVEILFLARKLGARIVEVPVNWHNVLGSKVSPWRDSFTMFFDLLRIRWRHRRM